MSGRRAAIGTATLIAIAMVWLLLTSVTGWVGGARFPSPAEFWQAIVQINGRGYAGAPLVSHAVHSLKLVALGFAVAGAAGIAAASMPGTARWRSAHEIMQGP